MSGNEETDGRGDDGTGGDSPRSDDPGRRGTASVARTDGGRTSDVRGNFVRFVAVVLVVDALGLGLWRLLPPGTSIRTAILFGTLVVAPLIGFLVVYVPAASEAT